MTYKKIGPKSEIKLTAPWEKETQPRSLSPVKVNGATAELADHRQTASGLPDTTAQMFLQERTRVHEVYIREQERTKRLGLVLAAVLIIAAATSVLFAPAGRETVSYWIGAALVIFAAGAVGYKRVWGKSANNSFGADQDQRDL